MTLETLQTIATALVESIFNIIWLRWWNSSKYLRFPFENIKDKKFDKWLIKMSFWAQVFHFNVLWFVQSLWCMCVILQLEEIWKKMSRFFEAHIYLSLLNSLKMAHYASNKSVPTFFGGSIIIKQKVFQYPIFLVLWLQLFHRMLKVFLQVNNSLTSIKLLFCVESI